MHLSCFDVDEGVGDKIFIFIPSIDIPHWRLSHQILELFVAGACTSLATGCVDVQNSTEPQILGGMLKRITNHLCQCLQIVCYRYASLE